VIYFILFTLVCKSNLCTIRLCTVHEVFAVHMYVLEEAILSMDLTCREKRLFIKPTQYSVTHRDLLSYSKYHIGLSSVFLSSVYVLAMDLFPTHSLLVVYYRTKRKNRKGDTIKVFADRSIVLFDERTSCEKQSVQKECTLLKPECVVHRKWTLG